MKHQDLKQLTFWGAMSALLCVGLFALYAPAFAAGTSSVKFLDTTGTPYGVQRMGNNIPVFGDATVSIAAGEVSGFYAVNKYGLATAGVQTTATDIWDLADATPSQQIWLAPTAARIHTIVSSDATDVSGIGTLTLTGQPLDTETVTIATKVYTFQTTLTDADGNVKIGADASGSLDNLIAAINLAAGGGTTYAASMTANDATTEAAAGAGDTMTLWDHTSTAIATEETLTNGSWGAGNSVNGAGAVAIRVWYLPDWDTKETTAVVYLHGDVGTAMSTAAVMINRMKVISNGTSYNINAGKITATAASDSTVSSQISIGNGQSLHAIYGFPSVQTGYVTGWNADGHDAANPGTASEVDFTLLVNESPDLGITTFINKSNTGTTANGSSNVARNFNPYFKIDGPAIIKVQATATAADTTGAAEFDMILVDD